MSDPASRNIQPQCASAPPALTTPVGRALLVQLRGLFAELIQRLGEGELSPFGMNLSLVAQTNACAESAGLSRPVRLHRIIRTNDATQVLVLDAMDGNNSRVVDATEALWPVDETGLAELCRTYVRDPVDGQELFVEPAYSRITAKSEPPRQGTVVEGFRDRRARPKLEHFLNRWTRYLDREIARLQHDKPNAERRPTLPRLLTGPPLTAVGPLPADLSAALNGAVYLALTADSIRQFLVMHTTDRSKALVDVVITMVDAIREVRNDCRTAVVAVTMELNTTRDRPARFGAIVEPNAHQAAIALASDVLNAVWESADPVTWTQCLFDETARMDSALIAERFDAVCDHVRSKQFPDGKEIVAEVQLEASKAAQARTNYQNKGPRLPKAKGRRGRKRPSEQERRRRETLEQEWTRFKEAKSGTMKDFCADKGMKVDDLERVLAALRTQRRKAKGAN